MSNATATLTLAEFLLARFAEDEAAIREVPLFRDTNLRPVLNLVIQSGRLMAECEAKRRIVEAFEDERVRRDIYNRDYDSGEYEFNDNDLRNRLLSNARCGGLEVAILALAAPYADHPDFRDEWRA